MRPRILAAGLAPLAALTLALPAAAQSGNVTVGGVIDLSLRHTRNSVGSMDSLSSGNNSTSRLYFTGSEDLGDGLKAGFHLEAVLGPDVGSAGLTVPAGQLFDRGSYVKLSGRLGELRLGRDWTPSFLSFALSDAFGYVGVGGAASLFATSALVRAFGAVPSTLSRSNNAVSYFLPAMGGAYGQLMKGFGENGNASGNFDFLGGRVGWRDKAMDASAYFADTRIDGGGHFKQSGVAGSYDFGTVMLSGSWTGTSYLGTKASNLIVGATIPVGVMQVRLAYGRVDQSGTNAAGASIDANDAQLLGLGVTYNLSKRSAIYASLGHIANKGAATFAVPGGPAGVAGGSSSDGIEFGIRHAF